VSWAQTTEIAKTDGVADRGLFITVRCFGLEKQQ